ncbi:HAD-IB family hydrolase [Acetobacteraceae bacterium]|nr:HAD-IB family hydrolase [Acetobacteraceae bacterium]
MPFFHTVSSRKVAFFDFDGTLLRGDSGWRFLLFCFRLRDFPNLFLLFLGVLKDFFTGKINRNRLKERLFGAVLRRRSLKEIYMLGKIFSQKHLLENYQFRDVFQKFEMHKQRGDRCILVSASLGEYLAPWALKNGFEAVLATRLEKGFDGCATGRFMSKNCHGPEKKKRILAYLKSSKAPEESIAYGNSSGDFEMFEMVLEAQGKAFFVLPNGKIKPWLGR